ncbi:hypothetical protein ACFSYG_13720 [Leeuwenhoekiella polynyae]|uniref:Uncharacterized protein n=1 Tax=Leeuwenhoekiella polynyae TaxID=1550906 RepID=A0A4Q0P4F2_9FLAO|nr:hypothetical protein [Leeuwenhoekiella polynyae]RXG21271.1 hypothetical protein DSM02_2124 [Leeuwenhoekiella polynyae]
MTEFDKIELLFINKLINKIKYQNLSLFESNQFANSPIGNSILEKIKNEFESQILKYHKYNKESRIGGIQYEFDNHIGKSIQERLNEMDNYSFQAIIKFDEEETQKFAMDILGPIEYDQDEFIKLVDFIKVKANEKTGG